MKNVILILFFLSSAALVVWVGFFYNKNLRGAGPAVSSPPADIAKLIDVAAVNKTDFPLTLPDGFEISVFADDVEKARVIAFDHHGNTWLSRTRDNVVTFLDVEDGKVVAQEDVFTNLNHPHGLLFDNNNPSRLYIAEESKISYVDLYSEERLDGETDLEWVKRSLQFTVVPVASADVTDAPNPIRKIVDLPNGGGHRNHFTRTLHYAPDGTMLVSIGSSCNVCFEKDDARGTVQALTRDDTGAWGLQVYATGLRNAVFLANHPTLDQVWVTEMGRDELGDDVPPDEINILKKRQLNSNDLPGNYGWPRCYGDHVWDQDFVSGGEWLTYCLEETEKPHYNLQAHAAPLGLAFAPDGTFYLSLDENERVALTDEEIAMFGNEPAEMLQADSDGLLLVEDIPRVKDAWPAAYDNNLFVAFHGSWNRTDPVGYKIGRYEMDVTGAVTKESDFITGWLTEDNKALGRPVDIKFHDGDMYISDDKAGVIYKVVYLGDNQKDTAADVKNKSKNAMDTVPPFSPTDIVDLSLQPGTVLTLNTTEKEVELSGLVMGSMAFEGDFPVYIKDADGNVVASAIAFVPNWMTIEKVPFTVQFSFEKAVSLEKGVIVFQKDNVSGLPEHDMVISYPIRLIE